MTRFPGLLLLPVLAACATPPPGSPSPPAEPARIAWWRDLKLGLMMHWGPYSQWGIVESWSLCSEDEPWCKRNLGDYADYKRHYERLKSTFDPVAFDPDRWAAAAADAGMRYVVFTTKHHDGFCMFDSQETDYKVTDPGCPFHARPRANITKEIFRAFRARGLGIGAYFSKPDWHSEYYWWPYFATPDRHVNYDPAKYPDRWQRFCDFTYRQIEELMTGYGTVDILWLDGAWVRPLGNMPHEYESWARKRDWNQGIDMPRIAKMARGHQPGLILVDRWVGGEFEGYLTPEQKVPPEPLAKPWEACVTMGSSWSYTPTDRMKPTRDLVQLLVDVVAKGGNLLLNIGVGPHGDFAPEAYARLGELAAWMRVNGAAIHRSRPIAPYREGSVCYTRGCDGSVYAILLAEGTEVSPPATVRLPGASPPSGGTVTLLGVPGGLAWRRAGRGIVVDVPSSVRAAPPCQHAWVFRLGG